MARMRVFSRRLRKSRSTVAKFRPISEKLEGRLLLAADPALSLTLTPNPVAENAGAGAVTGTITRNNMDASQTLTVNLTTSDAAHATVASSVTIPAGQTSANFSVNPIDDGIADAGHAVTITGYAASPIAAGLDATFGSGGYANLTTLAAPSSANFPDVKVQPDGKIVAVASSSVSGVTWALSRTLPDGTPDPTFGTNGVVQTTFPNEGYVTADGANALALQPDGKIVVAGIIAGVPGDNYQDWGIARYNPDGTLDSGFGNGGFVRISFPGDGAWPYDVAVLSNGEILVAGNGSGGYTVARLTSNGQLDPNFGSSGIAHVAFDPTLLTYGTVHAMAVRPDGRIVLAGGAVGNYLPVASLNADGTPDTTFGGNGLALIPLADFGSFTNATGMGVALQPDGKVVVAGYASGGSTTFGDFIAARLNTNGTLDTSFSGDGVDAFNFSGYEGQANDVAIQADGKIVLAGWTNVGGSGPFYGQGFNLALARYNPDGTLDASFHDSKFNSPGKYVFDGLSSIFEEIWGVDLQSDGKLAAIVGYNNDLKAARFDTGLLAASQTLNVTNADGGPSPAAADDSYAMLQNDTLSVAAPGLLGNDSAVNSTPLTASLVSGPSHGNLALNADGSFTYTPTSGFFGSDSFSYQDAEGALASNVATVTITVQAPKAAGDSYSMTENDVLTVAAPGVLGNDTAVTSSALSAVLVSGPSHGALTLNADGSFTYAPNADFFGTDSFTYKDSEGTLSSNVATATITIRAPLAASDNYTVDENSVLSVLAPGVLGNDSAANSTPLAAVLVSGPSRGSLALNADGSFVYTPTVNYYGADSFVYKDAEGGVFSNTAAVSITVNRVDHAPVAADDGYAAAAGSTRIVLAPGVLANDSDPDGDPLTAILVSGPSHGSLTLNSNGSFNYTPDASYSGADSFTYRAYDGLLYSAVATVSLTVDQPPVVQNASYTLDENSSVAVPITGSDVETPTAQLIFVVAQLPAHGSLTDPNGNAVTAGERFAGPVTLTYAPANDYYGSDSISYYAVDNQFSGNVGVVSLTVNHVNQPPVAVNDAFSTNEDAPLTIIGPGVTSLAMQSDPGDWVGGGGTYNFTPATGLFSAGHTANDNDLIFSYHDASYSQWWYLEFAAPLGAPLLVGTYLNAGRAAFRPDTQPGLDVYGDGRGSNTLTGSFVVTQAVYDANGNVINFDATFEQHSEGATPALRGEIKYNAIPPMTGVLLNDSDVDSPTLTAALVGAPSHGTVQLNSNGSFTYTPEGDFNGVDSFTYKANDGSLDSNVATVSITVNPVNDAPSFAKGADQAIAEGAGAQAVPGWATGISAGPPDESSQALDFQVSTNNNSLFAVTPSIDPTTGTLSFTPAPGALGSATVTVALHDNGGTANGGVDTSAPQTFVISINNVAPMVILGSNVSLNEGDALSSVGSFADPGNENWIATVDYGDGSGVQPLALNADKTFNLSHIYADNGVYNVIVTVDDGNNGSGSSALVVTVNNVAPTATLSSSGPINEGAAATISFSSPVDPSSADVAAGFHYSFATSTAALASNYADAGAADSTSLTFDDNGTYTVYGRIFDKDGGYTTYSTVVTANNVSPTATLGNNGPVNEASPATIAFTNPFDPSTIDTQSGFHYSFATSAARLAESYAAAGSSSAADFTFNDNGSYTVYGRIFDKDGGYTDYTTVVTVNNALPTAAAAGPAVAVRGQTQTFTLSASDPSPVDQAATFSYLVDWGDGSPQQTVAGAASTVQANHLFAASGAFTVRVWATDKDGGQSASPGAFALAVQAAALEGGDLVIGGTTAADSIIVAPSDQNGNLAVTINGASAGVFHPAGQIIVYAQAGNDQVRLQSARIGRSTVYVSVQAALYGGDGNDTLDARGSTANDILLGEAGNDALYGGRGRNLLVGGLGADSLNGGSGDDILIGGTTDDDGDLAALDAIMAEWGRTDLTYQQRINQLTGAAGGGLNGSYDLNDTTVHDDAAIDQLQGNGGTDWWFARVSGANADVILHKQKAEIVTSI